MEFKVVGSRHWTSRWKGHSQLKIIHQKEGAVTIKVLLVKVKQYKNNHTPVWIHWVTLRESKCKKHFLKKYFLSFFVFTSESTKAQ